MLVFVLRELSQMHPAVTPDGKQDKRPPAEPRVPLPWVPRVGAPASFSFLARPRRPWRGARIARPPNVDRRGANGNAAFTAAAMLRIEEWARRQSCTSRDEDPGRSRQFVPRAEFSLSASRFRQAILGIARNHAGPSATTLTRTGACNEPAHGKESHLCCRLITNGDIVLLSGRVC